MVKHRVVNDEQRGQWRFGHQNGARHQFSLKNRDSRRRSVPATIPTSRSPYHKNPLGYILIPGEMTSPIVAIVGSFGGKSRAIFDLFGLSVWAEICTPENSRARTWPIGNSRQP